jgi:hypothetical protein
MMLLLTDIYTPNYACRVIRIPGSLNYPTKKQFGSRDTPGTLILFDPAVIGEAQSRCWCRLVGVIALISLFSSISHLTD